MRIDVKKAKTLGNEPQPLEGRLALDRADVDGDEPCADAAYEGAYRWCGDGIRIDGSASVRLKSRCDRCGKAIDHTLSAELNDRFVPRGAENETDSDYAYDGDSIDVDAYVREKLLLALPAQRLCKTDCKGLCPVCGADRNERPCGCEAERAERENPFAILKQSEKGLK